MFKLVDLQEISQVGAQQPVNKGECYHTANDKEHHCPAKTLDHHGQRCTCRGGVFCVGGSHEKDTEAHSGNNYGPRQVSTLEPEQQEQGNKSQEGLEQIGPEIALESWIDDLKGHHIEKMNLIPQQELIQMLGGVTKADE